MFNAIRLEHPSDNKGIFQHTENGERADVCVFLESVADRHINFPTMPEELRWENYRDKFCAYKNLEQMKEWITDEEIQIIISKGFKVYLLDLFEATVTDYQVIFRREDIIQQKDITSMFQTK